MMSFPSLKVFLLPLKPPLCCWGCSFLARLSVAEVCSRFLTFESHAWRGGLSGTAEFPQGRMRRSFKALLHVATFPAHQSALQAPQRR